MFCFRGPVNVGFDCAKNSNFVTIDCLASVNPFAPVVVGVNSACVLKSDVKGGGKVLSGNGGEVIAPGGCG